MAIKAIYDNSFDINSWFDVVAKVEGWFDKDWTAEAVAPPAGSIPLFYHHYRQMWVEG